MGEDHPSDGGKVHLSPLVFNRLLETSNSHFENCTQRVIEKITTSDSYYKIEEKNHSVTV